MAPRLLLLLHLQLRHRPALCCYLRPKAARPRRHPRVPPRTTLGHHPPLERSQQPPTSASFGLCAPWRRWRHRRRGTHGRRGTPGTLVTPARRRALTPAGSTRRIRTPRRARRTSTALPRHGAQSVSRRGREACRRDGRARVRGGRARAGFRTRLLSVELVHQGRAAGAERLALLPGRVRPVAPLHEVLPLQVALAQTLGKDPCRLVPARVAGAI